MFEYTRFEFDMISMLVLTNAKTNTYTNTKHFPLHIEYSFPTPQRPGRGRAEKSFGSSATEVLSVANMLYTIRKLGSSSVV